MFEGMEGVTEIEQAGTWGEGVLILFIGDNVMIKVPKAVYHEEDQKLH